MSKKVPPGNAGNSHAQKSGLKKWSLFYLTVIFVLIIIASVVVLHETGRYLQTTGEWCVDEIDEYSIFQRQELRNGDLYIYASFEHCTPIGCGYCWSVLEPDPLRSYWFDGTDELMNLEKGDRLKVRWCHIPDVGHRIRGVTKQ